MPLKKLRKLYALGSTRSRQNIYSQQFSAFCIPSFLYKTNNPTKDSSISDQPIDSASICHCKVMNFNFSVNESGLLSY